MKDVYEVLNTECYVNDEVLEKIKKEKDNFYRYLKLYLKYDKKVKYFKYKNEDEDEYEINKKIENESFDIDLIFKVLNEINFTWEMDEYAFCQKKAFLNIYDVFYINYKELEY